MNKYLQSTIFNLVRSLPLGLSSIFTRLIAPSRLPLLLWFLLLLFCLRVIGQMLVAFLGVPFLPPMEEWYSGLLPYPWLLPSQFLIILLYGQVCLDFTHQRGFFFTPRPSLGKPLLIFGWIYFGAMVIRYVVRMSLYPDERWFGGMIPIFFHGILATFILLVGWYHWTQMQSKTELTPDLKGFQNL